MNKQFNCEQVLFVRFYNNPALFIRSMQFHYCTVSNPGTGADDAFVLKRCVQRNATWPSHCRPAIAAGASQFQIGFLPQYFDRLFVYLLLFMHQAMCNIIWHLRMFTQRLFRRWIELNQQPMPLWVHYFYSRRLHSAYSVQYQRIVVNRCFDSIKVILCRSILCSIVFCLADFMFSVYLGLKLT